ncbi:MAG TPA: alpha/beta hydrolase [Syntrophorhabdaceae bacterium]|jgi:pimeloyl-ACP methyl ester carboxylesterase
MTKWVLTICIFAFLSISWLPAPLCRAGNDDGQAPVRNAVTEAATGLVRVGDIDVSYRVKGEGFPIILITGYSATMDIWDPLTIEVLSARYKVIIFDNRGIGKTTASDKPFTIELFAEDTRGLMDALKIKKAHLLGWSMGTFIATELALRYPEKVDKLILYAGNCDWTGSDVVEARPEVLAALMDLSGSRQERSGRLVSILYPGKWLDDHPDFLQKLPRAKEQPLRETLERQGNALASWKGTCKRIGTLSSPTLIITGTEDVVIPPANSLRMAAKIPGSWLIRMPGGHSAMHQYPETFSRCLRTFLDGEKE